MQMKYQDLLTRLKRDPAPPQIFLYGEEQFFRDRVLRQIIDATVPESARDFNLTVMYGKDVSSRKLAEEVRTYPVFADRRLVVVRDAHQLPAAELEKLAAVLDPPVAESVVVFVADKIDKRRKFFQQFQKNGVLVEFKPLYDNQIPAFINDLLVEQGLRITEAGMTAFCRRTGNNLQEIASELQKLAAFLGEEKLIDVADVEQVVSQNRHQSVFALTDALGLKQAAEALRVLRELLDEGESPVGVLSMLARHFRQLWKISALLERGVSHQEIPGRVAVNPYFARGLIRQARNFSAVEYRDFFRCFVEADLRLKSSGAHPSAILESVLLRIAATTSPGS